MYKAKSADIILHQTNETITSNESKTMITVNERKVNHLHVEWVTMFNHPAIMFEDDDFYTTVRALMLAGF